jgi:hypothetical protein
MAHEGIFSGSRIVQQNGPNPLEISRGRGPCGRAEPPWLPVSIYHVWCEPREGVRGSTGRMQTSDITIAPIDVLGT